ncbi:hypothetical protein MPLB_1880045 [Mesorhizobium sp. ORS 3324]|nr:hypothetical protein MPLB_1880045 [Mesorhizobium sp. ORS 3324]
MRLDHDNLLAPAFHQPLVFPGRKQPAYRVKRRARHLSDVLARNREIDQDPFLGLLSRLFDQLEQCIRNALFDLLGGHLDDAHVGILQPASHHLVSVGTEARKARRECRPEMAWPGKHHAIDGGDGICRIGRPPQRAGYPHQLARAYVSHGHLVPGRGRFYHAHMAVEQQEERMGLLLLLEHRLIPGDPHGPCLSDYAIEIGGSDPLKDGQPGNQRSIKACQLAFLPVSTVQRAQGPLTGLCHGRQPVDK